MIGDDQNSDVEFEARAAWLRALGFDDGSTPSLQQVSDGLRGFARALYGEPALAELDPHIDEIAACIIDVQSTPVVSR